MTPAQRWMERVASLGCMVCRRIHGKYVPAELHHIAEGSGLRNAYAVVPLCGDEYEDHHDGRNTGGAGFHRLGTKAFCKLYRVPGEVEWGMFAWLAEDMAKSERKA